ncbi:hypothetical protein DERF_010053 [Dermatophagoides farinae]|uniref:Sema domain-containing protein n=1 Tax=Dermatophagoides farinae TaxID=6954 RepID=A0A922HW79_DERFA|nr:hypothetical protein DERF_010053 [Dermatophagoides farinae]
MAIDKCNSNHHHHRRTLGDDNDDNNFWPWTLNGRPPPPPPPPTTTTTQSSSMKTKRTLICQPSNHQQMSSTLLWIFLIFILSSCQHISTFQNMTKQHLSSSPSSSSSSSPLMNIVNITTVSTANSSKMTKILVKNPNNNDTLIVSSPSCSHHLYSRHKHLHSHHQQQKSMIRHDSHHHYHHHRKLFNKNRRDTVDSNTLRVEHAVRTGPIRDSPSCPPSDCSGVDPNLVQITNNVNKILLIEPYARMLIVCGSVHQGACTRHRLEDISQHEDLIPLPVASNDENSSTIAFVGPARYFGVQLTPILYVAATDSRIGPYRDMVPAISGRSLESSRLFTIIDRGFADSARVDISSNIRDYFLVNYVYGFYANDYVYFAQIQRRSYLRTLEEMGYVTRLSRVCVSDAGFHTYTELTLECIHHQQYSSSSSSSTTNNGRYHHHHHHHHQHSSKMNNLNIEQFNLLQDAILIKAGSDLSDSLNIERGSLVLIGVFANSHDHTNRPNGGKSALCVYPIADIEQRFAENIHLCYNGSVYSRNMDYIAGSVNQCPEPGTISDYYYCHPFYSILDR